MLNNNSFRFYVISQTERNKKKNKEKEIYMVVLHMFPSIFTVQILIASINKKVIKKFVKNDCIYIFNNFLYLHLK